MESTESIKKTPSVLMTVPLSSRVEMLTKESVSLSVFVYTTNVCIIVYLGPSRRGDLEILGYVLVQWACGVLPWESKIANKDLVAQEKEK